MARESPGSCDGVVRLSPGRHCRPRRRLCRRGLYAERQEVLLDGARQLRGLLEIEPSAAGMHMAGWLGAVFATQGGPAGQAAMIDRTAARQAAHHGVTTQPLSAYCIEPVRQGALLRGYAAASELEIRDGVEHGVNGVQGIPSANGHASATGVTRATGAERDRSVGQVPKVWPAR